MGIKKGDKVKVLRGKDKGKIGKVLQVFPDHDRLSVEGANLSFKNVRPRRQGEKGQRIQFPSPLPLSVVSLVCPHCGKITRAGQKILENKQKVRICKKCKQTI